MTSTAGYGSEVVDERLVAKAALDAAEEQLESLCASHAGTFVSVQRRSASLAQSLERLQDAISDISIEDSQQVLQQETSLAQVSERHRVRRRTLLQHSALLELLELPSLMDACVRSMLYEQALSIAAFANTLERRQSDVVVQRVISQIRGRVMDLRRHLLHRLCGVVTMPQCLEIVTALRRLNSIDLERSEVNLEKNHAHMELKLQVDFLEARDTWLDSVGSSNNNKTTQSEQLLDTIERYRTRCFEIATQFLAIFRASPGTTTSSSNNNDSSPSSLLTMWTTRRVHSFLTMLSMYNIPDTASLRDVWEASSFFATSMGRLGADFSSLLPPILEPKLVSLVASSWKEGLSNLQDTLRLCRDAGLATPLVSQTVDDDKMDLEDLPAVQGKTPPPPPRQLLAYPPMARFLNAYLTGLNELRRCLLGGTFAFLQNELDQLLDELHVVLETNEKSVLTPGLKGEATQLRKVAETYKKLLEKILIPYMKGALHVAFGDYETAKVLLPKREKLVVVVEQPEVETEESLEPASLDNETHDDLEKQLDEFEESNPPNVSQLNEESTLNQVEAVEDKIPDSNAGGWNEDDLGDL